MKNKIPMIHTPGDKTRKVLDKYPDFGEFFYFMRQYLRAVSGEGKVFSAGKYKIVPEMFRITLEYYPSMPDKFQKIVHSSANLAKIIADIETGSPHRQEEIFSAEFPYPDEVLGCLDEFIEKKKEQQEISIEGISVRFTRTDAGIICTSINSEKISRFLRQQKLLFSR